MLKEITRNDFDTILNDMNKMFSQEDRKPNSVTNQISLSYFHDDEEEETLVIIFDSEKAMLFLNDWLVSNYGLNLFALENNNYIHSVFYDEVSMCQSCGCSISMNDYGMNIDYWIDKDGYYRCSTCTKDDENLRDDYFEELTDNYNKANTLFTNAELESYGFNKLEGLYSLGLHTYDEQIKPVTVLNGLQSKGYNNIIFSITSNDMFETNYIVFVR